MLKANFKNYLLIILLTIFLIGGIFHFNDICDLLTITFEL